jgi:hypothetical protein
MVIAKSPRSHPTGGATGGENDAAPALRGPTGAGDLEPLQQHEPCHHHDEHGHPAPTPATEVEETVRSDIVRGRGVTACHVPALCVDQPWGRRDTEGVWKLSARKRRGPGNIGGTRGDEEAGLYGGVVPPAANQCTI